VLSVHPSVPAQTVKQLIALAKSSRAASTTDPPPGAPTAWRGAEALAGIDVVHIRIRVADGGNFDRERRTALLLQPFRRRSSISRADG
jgi:hypothetical protein